MNVPQDPTPTKGMRMIAAYRAERLSQRPVLRTALHQSHVARRAARCPGGTAPDAPPAPEAEAPEASPPAAPAPGAAAPGSVFASLVSGADAERRQAAGRDATLPEPPAPEQSEPEQSGPAASLPYDPPLAEIGFGPGMLIRLSQLGLRTTGDLAHADAAELRAALGEISRLVDVEAWIASARRSLPGHAAGGKINRGIAA
jgi:hypothetical protein